MISLIAAVALDGAIGKDNKMLWKISEDLQFYKAMTTDNIILVGRKTYESLPKVALKNRRYYVVSSQIGPNKTYKEYDDENIDVSFSPCPKSALYIIDEDWGLEKNKIFIGGGQTIYEQLINECETAHITWVGSKYPDADTHFPVKKLYSNFTLVSESDWIESGDEETPAYKFSTYRRVKFD